MRLIENLGHPGAETINALQKAFGEPIRHAWARVGFGGAIDALRVYQRISAVHAFRPEDYSVIVDSGPSSAQRFPAYGTLPTIGISGQQWFTWQRRSAFLRWYGRANQGLAGGLNGNGFGFDGVNLGAATMSSPWVPGAFPIAAWTAENVIGPGPAGTTGITEDPYKNKAYPATNVDTDFTHIIGNWGPWFRDALSFQTIDGTWVDPGWANSAADPAGINWNSVLSPGKLFESFPFTNASPSMSGDNGIAVIGRRSVVLSAGVQPMEIYQPTISGIPGCFFGHVPDDARIIRARMELTISNLSGSSLKLEFQANSTGGIENKPGFPQEETTVPPVRLLLMGGQRYGEGDSAGTRWFPLGVSLVPVNMVSDRQAVVDITGIAQAWHSEIRKSKYHVIGLVPAVGSLETEVPDSNPADVLSSLALPDEYSIYTSPARTTTGARGGVAYYPGTGGNVDKVYESKLHSNFLNWGTLSGGNVHIEWVPGDSWKGLDAPFFNWPVFNQE